jgi:hypothetical protein
VCTGWEARERDRERESERERVCAREEDKKKVVMGLEE